MFRLLILVALLTSAGMQANAEEPSPYIVEVSDVTAKVGDPAVLRATLRVRDDYRILKGYNNRLIKLSSFDDGVVFERGMVPAALDEGALVPGRIALTHQRQKQLRTFLAHTRPAAYGTVAVRPFCHVGPMGPNWRGSVVSFEGPLETPST